MEIKIEIETEDLFSIIDKENIIQMLIDNIEHRLPYNDFGYMGLWDLDKYAQDFNLDITNKQYLQLLLLEQNITKIELQESPRGTKWLVCHYGNNYKTQSMLFYNTEDNVYYIREKKHNCEIINTILYYVGLLYKNFKIFNV